MDSVRPSEHLSVDLYGRRSIETRFVFYLTVLVLIIMVFSALILTQEHLRTLKLDALQLAERIFPVLPPAMSASPRLKPAFPADPRISCILARDPRGTEHVILGKPPPYDLLEEMREPHPAPDFEVSSEDGNSYWGFQHNEGGWSYTLLVSREQATRDIRVILISLCWIGGVALFLHYLIARVMARVVLRPFKQFLEGMSNTIEGRYGFKFETAEKDEVGQLKQTFNYMQRQLEEKSLMESRLLEQERLATVGHLAAGVAHEIRNPMASVSSLTQLIAGASSENPKLQEYCKVILGEVDRINVSIDQLLNIARKTHIHQEERKLSSILDNVIKLMTFQANARSIQLKLVNHWPVETPIHVEPGTLEQVFINLVKNSLEAMDAGGTVEIVMEYDAEGERVIAAVEDDGPGIPPSIVDHLFDPYYTSKRLGTGIGLSICAKIISEHDGTIAVDRLRARGARFVVALPMRPPRLEGGAEPRGEGP